MSDALAGRIKELVGKWEHNPTQMAIELHDKYCKRCQIESLLAMTPHIETPKCAEQGCEFHGWGPDKGAAK